MSIFIFADIVVLDFPFPVQFLIFDALSYRQFFSSKWGGAVGHSPYPPRGVLTSHQHIVSYTIFAMFVLSPIWHPEG